jgi:IPT/TIG domain/Bacterial Ig-like domain
MNSLTELNNFSAQSVAYDDQGTGAQTLADRYQINGLIDTAQSVMQNIEKICSAAGSWLSYDIHEGKWGVIINTTGTSIASFNDTNILGSISINGTGINELYNAVKVEFPHRELRDSADFVTIQIASVDRNANEEDNTLNLTYDIINEPVQAQLLGLIELKQSRIDLAISFQTDYSNINIKAGNLIDVTNERFGFVNKLFRVISSSEIQDDDGALKIEIVALEYNANVYSTADLYRYTRTDANGIITIGSIGVPGTPQVTKIEKNSRPRIIIETTSPTGVVEGIEYWITEDTLVAEANRSYRLIGTRRPSGGNTFTSGVTVTLEYDAITTGDFIVKTRGINASTTGPFSTPSGLIEFVAQQTTDAIGPNTAVVDPTGALLTGLAASYVLGQIADVITGNASTSSFVYKIFDRFKDITGVDLIGQASSGTLVVSSNLAVQDEGIPVTAQTQAINFTGDLVTAELVGNTVNVNIGGTGGGGITSGGLIVNSINPNVGPIGGDTVVTITGSNLSSATNVTFGGVTATSFTVVSNTSVTAITPSRASTGSVSVNVITSTTTNTANSLFTYIGGTSGNGSGGHIDITQILPPDRTTYADPLTGLTSDTAPITGSYFARFSAAYGALTIGSGTAKLYKSNGTLVETLNAGSLTINNDVVEFPFAPREYGTDYYILLDTGLVEYCNKLSRAIVSPTIWNFNTPLYSSTAYTMTATTFVGPTAPTAISITPNTINTPFTSKLSIQWSTAVTTGTGNVYVKDFNTDVTALTFTAAELASGDTSLGTLEAGKKYYVAADAGIVKNTGDCYILSQTNSAAIVKANNLTFTMISALQLITFIVDANPVGSNKINPQTNIGLVFNQAIQLGNFGSFTLKTAAGATHQTFNVTDTFGAQQVSEVLFIGSTGTYTNSIVWLNPTKDLTLGTTYYVNADNGTVKDFFGQTWTGLSNSTTVRFTVDAGPTASFAPISSTSTKLVMTFDRPIEAGTGTLIVKVGSTILQTATSTSSSVTLA